MAIEGPLRELGIHDVFQLLDLSRKTGALRVRSTLRDNEGIVWFDTGHVIAADMRSNPHRIGALLVKAGKITEEQLADARARQAEGGDRRRLGEILVASGAISQRELDRNVRQQVETVVFELMSWEEGFFSFSDRNVREAAVDAIVRISTESLLMEGARRLDEWARIAHRIPHVGVVPVLATPDDDHASSLELLPREWEVLAAIDGSADLRAIASQLGRSEFDVAKVAYGLLSTGVIAVDDPRSGAQEDHGSVAVAAPPAVSRLTIAREAFTHGRLGEALHEWEQFLAECPGDLRAPRVRELVTAATRMHALLGSVDDD
jgi:hypothetical protein